MSAEYCGGAEWEPQSVSGPKGAPFYRDVEDCVWNGGTERRFDEFNTPGNSTCPRQRVPFGEDVEVRWKIFTPLAIRRYTYYLTTRDFDQSYRKRLTYRDFNETPIARFPGHPPGPDELVHTLPAHVLQPHEGYGILLAVQDTIYTPNAFYNCIDLDLSEKRSDPTGLPPNKVDLK